MRRFLPDLVVFLIATVVFCRGSLPLLEPEESRYAEIPRQMLVEQSFVVPVLDGQAYLDKPPLLYWLVMASYSLFGVAVWPGRMVATIIAALTVNVVFRWSRQLGGNEAGWMATAILLLMPDYVYRGPMLTMNGLLGFCVTLALAAGQRAIQRDRIDWRWGLISAIACGLGVLAKGPVAIVLVSPLAWWMWSQRFSVWSMVSWGVVYLAVIGMVAGPWFVAVARREPEFVSYFFWKHHVERAMNPFDHVKPWWFYLPQVFLGALPWWPISLLAIRKRVPGIAFPLITAAVALLFFSAAGSKRPVYLVPFFPPLAVALAIIAVQTFRFRWHLVAVMAVLQSIALLAWLPGYHHRFSIEDVVEPIRSSDRVFAHVHAWPAEEFRRGQIIRYLDDEAIRQLEAPRSGERIGILTTPQQVERLDALLAAKPGTTHHRQNGVVAVLIWDGPVE